MDFMYQVWKFIDGSSSPVVVTCELVYFLLLSLS